MKYTVKVTISDYNAEEPKTVVDFQFSNKEDIYEALIFYARDFTSSFTYLDEWFCISTMDEGGYTIIEFKDYQDYIDDIKLPIRELPQPEDIFDERTSK